MSGITYADLVTGAGRLITDGVLDARRRPFDHAEDARHALADFHAVLDAIESHTWALIGPSRLAGISPATRTAPVVADAIGMVAGLRGLVGAQRPHPSMLDTSARPWSQAALHLRGASDLLSVHLDHWGHQRSPDASVLGDSSARDAALIRVAGQLDTALAVETTLGLRCLQAGVSKTEVSRFLPGLEANRAFAAHLTAPGPDVAATGDLDRLRLIGEPLRTTDPVLHAADLILRLRQATWALRLDPDYSLATLSDLATAGLAIHAHGAAAHGANLSRTPPVLTEHAAPLVARAATWRALRTDLATYQAPGPADPHIRADVLTLRNLLPTLAPLDGSRSTDPEITGLLVAATHACEEIATTTGDVFRRLATSGHVHIPARHLTGEQLGEDPALITAKVHGTTVPAPRARWQTTTDLWHVAAGYANPHFTPLEQTFAAAHHTEPVHVLTRQPLERSTR